MTTRIRTSSLAACLLALVWGCDPQAPDPLDPGYSGPLLRDLVLSAATVNTDTILVGEERLPDDVITIRIITSVRLTRWAGSTDIPAVVRDGSGSRITSEALFLDNGVYPDPAQGDSVFTGILSFSVERSVVGLFTVDIAIADDSGLPGNSLTGSVVLFRANQPPAISGLQADTMVSLSGDERILQLRLTASDPDGLSDIHRVWFASYRPDSVASSGNPFFLFDDGLVNGISGDQTAGDGVYSLKIELPPTAMLGTYRFSFRASDRSRDSSNVIDHFLTVVP